MTESLLLRAKTNIPSSTIPIIGTDRKRPTKHPFDRHRKMAIPHRAGTGHLRLPFTYKNVPSCVRSSTNMMVTTPMKNTSSPQRNLIYTYTVYLVISRHFVFYMHIKLSEYSTIFKKYSNPDLSRRNGVVSWIQNQISIQMVVPHCQ